jgi:uncharacterized damage-inducible protein DinB
MVIGRERASIERRDRTSLHLATMSDIDEQGRPEAPLAADEVATALGFLEFHRATLAWKIEGLDAAALATTTASSTMTLGGMLKHLALVEESWFSERFAGNEPSLPWSEVDWEADADWDWHSAIDDTPEETIALWRQSVGASRAVVAAALAHGGFDQLARWNFRDGRSPSLRWIVFHMIEEYARHNGHADLLREAIDGQTGE